MAIAALFALLAFVLPALEGTSFDDRDAQRRAWLAGATPVFATMVWMMASTARTDLAARATALIVIVLAAATLFDGGHGAYALAFVPLVGLFASSAATSQPQLERVLVGLAVVGLANLLSPWLSELGVDLGLGHSDRAVLTVGVIAASAVTALSGRANGWRSGLAAGLAFISSLLSWPGIDWSEAGPGIAAAPFLFTLPTLAVMWARADDKLTWRDSV